MNLYLIKLTTNREYYVVADDSEEALKKLNDYIVKIYNGVVKTNWKEIKKIASNWQDERIGIFE